MAADAPGLTARSREQVRERLADFRAEYGDFERVEKSWSVPPDAYERDLERFERGASGGGGVWVTNDAGEVLLVRNEGDEGWTDPGGKREAGESFETAARREVREETGVTCEVTDLIEAHVIEITVEGADRPTLVSLIAIFAGHYVGGTVSPCDGEIAAARWFAETPDTVGYPEVAQRPVPVEE